MQLRELAPEARFRVKGDPKRTLFRVVEQWAGSTVVSDADPKTLEKTIRDRWGDEKTIRFDGSRRTTFSPYTEVELAQGDE